MPAGFTVAHTPTPPRHPLRPSLRFCGLRMIHAFSTHRLLLQPYYYLFTQTATAAAVGWTGCSTDENSGGGEH